MSPSDGPWAPDPNESTSSPEGCALRSPGMDTLAQPQEHTVLPSGQQMYDHCLEFQNKSMTIK